MIANLINVLAPNDSNPIIVLILIGIFIVLNVAVGIAVYLFKLVIKNNQEFYKRQTTVEGAQELTDRKLNILEEILTGVKESIKAHSDILEQLIPLIKDNHIKASSDRREEIKKISYDEWMNGYEFVKKYIEKNHSKLYKDTKEYMDAIFKESKKEIIERHKNVLDKINPIQAEMARNTTEEIFTDFLSRMNSFIHGISRSEELPIAWSSDLLRVFQTTIEAFDRVFSRDYE